MPMTNHEEVFNYALGAVLQNQRLGWKDSVETEQNGSIVGGKRADNLIYPKAMQPVVVEAAFERTANIDGDAIARLGKFENKNRREIMTAVALSIPYTIRNIKGGVSGMQKWLESGGELKYAVYSLVKETDNKLDGSFDIRYPDGEPNSSYITGTVSDLANLIELSATPDKRIKQAASATGGVVRGVAALMYKEIHETTRQQIAEKVGQPADEHAMRVAACVWLNALTLHSKLAKARPNDIASPSECKTCRQTINAWRSILKIDYRSVFLPALESLSLLSGYGNLVKDIIDRLNIQVELNNDLYVGSVADVSSDMFPELATDRQVTAAFYTRIEAAELLAGMAFNLIPQEKNNLKIADFACGTGALLKAAYRQVRRRAELDKNINLHDLHKNYMENCLHGADIQPIATHLTVAGLAGMCPEAEYKHSNIICADIRHGKTGALDLLKSEALYDLFGASKAGATDGDEHDFRPADNTFDLCIMNPPYSRPHRGRKIFGVGGIHADDRKASVKATSQYLSGTFANMKAGMASAFCLLADKKLRKGGILAAVLPSSAAGQNSWRQFRAHILHNYSDVIVVGGCNWLTLAWGKC
ncbi:MAG: Eco57I restriction-modification methylase domain-containing protein [Gammaproteobacteria bacterium WSBS_2016_MAG_OTU1]